MRIYEVTFEGHGDIRGLEIELQEGGNSMSILKESIRGMGTSEILWGGKYPRPYLSPDVRISGKRIRKLLFDAECSGLYLQLFNELSTVVRKLTGLDIEIWPWWAEMYRAMVTMRNIEQKNGKLWEKPTNESAEIFRTFIPTQGKDETLTKMMLACGFGFSGKITTTTESSIT